VVSVLRITLGKVIQYFGIINARIVYSFRLKLYRNKALESSGAKPPKATSTGTTIVGVIFKVRKLREKREIQNVLQ
jgi:hypothetical protein